MQNLKIMKKLINFYEKLENEMSDLVIYSITFPRNPKIKKNIIHGKKGIRKTSHQITHLIAQLLIKK